MRWWVGRRKAEWWKFSACGFHGLPKELKHITSAEAQSVTCFFAIIFLYRFCGSLVLYLGIRVEGDLGHTGT